MRLEGGGNDHIFSWRQFEAIAHLPRVDEGGAVGHRSATQQHIWTQVNVAAALVLKVNRNVTFTKQSNIIKPI